MSQFHFAEVMQALQHQLVLWIVHTLGNNPNIVKVGLVVHLQYILKLVVSSMLR